jgi:hypothetical protein
MDVGHETVWGMFDWLFKNGELMLPYCLLPDGEWYEWKNCIGFAGRFFNQCVHKRAYDRSGLAASAVASILSLPGGALRRASGVPEWRRKKEICMQQWKCEFGGLYA